MSPHAWTESPMGLGPIAAWGLALNPEPWRRRPTSTLSLWPALRAWLAIIRLMSSLLACTTMWGRPGMRPSDADVAPTRERGDPPGRLAVAVPQLVRGPSPAGLN